MEVLTDDIQLEAYMNEAYVAPEKPLLVDEYLGNAIELDVDAVCDGKEVLIGAVMEHLEETEFTQATLHASSRPKTSRIESFHRRRMDANNRTRA